MTERAHDSTNTSQQSQGERYRPMRIQLWQQLRFSWKPIILDRLKGAPNSGRCWSLYWFLEIVSDLCIMSKTTAILNTFVQKLESGQ